MPAQLEPTGAVGLYDPLVDLPRPRGDVAALTSRAVGFRRAAGAVAGVQERLAGARVLLGASWRGAAADQAGSALDSWCGQHRTATRSLQAAGSALGRHADLVARMQAQWDTARRLADSDSARQAAAAREAAARASAVRVDHARAVHHAASVGLPPPAVPVVSPYVPDPAAPDRLRAARLAADAVDTAARSTLLTARVLAGIEGSLGPRSRVRPDVVRSPGDAVRLARDEAGQVAADWRATGQGLLRLVTPGQAGDAWSRARREVVDGARRAREDPLGFAGDQLGDAVAQEEWEAGNTTRAVAGAALGLPGKVPEKIAGAVAPDVTDGRRDHDQSGPDGADPAAAVPAATRARAGQIASGHAYRKHVEEKGEFPEVSSPAAFTAMVAGIIDNPSDRIERPDGWSAYWDDATSTIVVVNARDPDGGTCFRPDEGREYFETLKRYNNP